MIFSRSVIHHHRHFWIQLRVYTWDHTLSLLNNRFLSCPLFFLHSRQLIIIVVNPNGVKWTLRLWLSWLSWVLLTNLAWLFTEIGTLKPYRLQFLVSNKQRLILWCTSCGWTSIYDSMFLLIAFIVILDFHHSLLLDAHLLRSNIFFRLRKEKSELESKFYVCHCIRVFTFE